MGQERLPSLSYSRLRTKANREFQTAQGADATAQQLEVQKKYDTFMAMDQHKMDAASGERKVMRKLAGSMELQELTLK
jgi:ABC-type molybdate transport system substrate-binding protein